MESARIQRKRKGRRHPPSRAAEPGADGDAKPAESAAAPREARPKGHSGAIGMLKSTIEATLAKNARADGSSKPTAEGPIAPEDRRAARERARNERRANKARQAELAAAREVELVAIEKNRAALAAEEHRCRQLEAQAHDLLRMRVQAIDDIKQVAHALQKREVSVLNGEVCHAMAGVSLIELCACAEIARNSRPRCDY